MEDLPEERMIDRWMSLMPSLKCRACGKAFGPIRQLELLKNRQALVKSYFEMCPQCREKALGQALLGQTVAKKEVYAG
jgi:hypothetical protein